MWKRHVYQMHYKIVFGWNIWKTHSDQISNIESNIYLANQINFNGIYTEN